MVLCISSKRFVCFFSFVSALLFIYIWFIYDIVNLYKYVMFCRALRALCDSTYESIFWFISCICVKVTHTFVSILFVWTSCNCEITVDARDFLSAFNMLRLVLLDLAVRNFFDEIVLSKRCRVLLCLRNSHVHSEYLSVHTVLYSTVQYSTGPYSVALSALTVLAFVRSSPRSNIWQRDER